MPESARTSKLKLASLADTLLFSPLNHTRAHSCTGGASEGNLHPLFCRSSPAEFTSAHHAIDAYLTVFDGDGLTAGSQLSEALQVGFLYLRYVADPKTLWHWFEPYIKDEEEFSPGSDGRMTTMGVYVRDLLLGQYYFDTLFPRIPVPVMRQIVDNLEKMKFRSKHCGVTGESTRHGSDDTARRPPSVKAALSVSFGQRAPHRASTRDSSPVRRIPPPPRERSPTDDQRRSPNNYRSHSREGHTRSGRDRDRRYDYDRRGDRDRRDGDSHWSKHSERESGRREYERSGRDSDCHRESSVRQSRSRSRSRSQSRSVHINGTSPVRRPSPFSDTNKDKTSIVSSNLSKLKDLYGDVTENKGDEQVERHRVDSGAEEVIRLGESSWR